MGILESFNYTIYFLLTQLWEYDTEIIVTFTSHIFFPLSSYLSEFSHNPFKVVKCFILRPSLASAIVWPGENLLILILELSSVLLLSLASIYKPKFGFYYKMTFVWVLFLFISFSSCFFFQWTWNWNLPLLYQNNSGSRNRNKIQLWFSRF